MHPSPYPTHPQAVSAWRRLERALVRLDPSRLRHRRLRRPQRRPRPRRHGRAAVRRPPAGRAAGALELLMSVARTGLPHTSRTTAAEDRSATPAPKGEPDRHRSTEPSNAIGRLSGSATTLQIAGTLRHAGDVPPANEPYRTWAPTLVTSWLKEHSWRWRRDHPLDVAQGGGRRAADGRTRVGAPPATATAADRPATRMGGPDAAGCRQAPGTAGAARPRAGG
jgi:hypothetical protein